MDDVIRGGGIRRGSGTYHPDLKIKKFVYKRSQIKNLSIIGIRII